MTLIAIILATLCAGIGSVWIAALMQRLGVRESGGGRDAQGLVGASQLLSLAAGALLATAFMHLLPEAFESGLPAQGLFATLLTGLVFFFLLDKAELWHHGHEHHHGVPPGEGAAVHDGHDGHDGHEHRHGHDHRHAHAHSHSHGPAPGTPAGGWTLLTGDSVHCFGDGILIASAFMADLQLGLVAALSVLAHEVPHHMGDLVVMRQASTRRVALLKVSLAGAVTLLGGVTGWWLVDRLQGWLPYFLTVASSSFVYVALADLIPQLQKRLGARATLVQVLWLAAGIALVSLASQLAHAH